MLEIKQKGNRFYKFSRLQHRSFPIKKSEALEKIANGEAVLVDKFITDPDYFDDVKTKQVDIIENAHVEEIEQPEVKSNKVISFADKLKAKQQKESFDDAINHFKNEILPNLKLDDMKKLMNTASNKDKFIEELMRAILRITLEKAAEEYKK